MTDKAKSIGLHSKRLSLIKEFWPRLFIGFIMMTVTVLLQLAFPKLIGYFIDNIQQQQESGWATKFALIAFGLLLLQALATAFRYYLFETTGYLIVTKIRRVLHQALINQTIGFFDKHNVGELMNRLSADVDVLEDTLSMGLAISLRSLFVMVGGIVMLFTVSPILCSVLLILIPISIFLGKWVGDKLRIRAKEIQQCQSDCAKVAHENFSNIRLVHAYNSQQKAQQQYVDETQNTYNISAACSRFIAKYQGGSSLLVYMALLIMLWVGAALISQGNLTVGELTSFILYAGMVTTAARVVSDFWSDWMRTIGATERIFEIIDNAQPPPTNKKKRANLQGNIAFENVSFHYPERPNQLALKQFQMSIKHGEKVALVGHSGAGKSTIAKLLLGFYQATDGCIEFDGTPMDELDIREVRRHVAIVEQEPALFSGSILDNITYGSRHNAVSLSMVQSAAKLANAEEFINQLPDAYETSVGGRGVQLSGGQKQRIAIARALIRDPQVLILDEATSALDTVSETKVQQALDNLMEDRTTIIIAHRISTITKADRIIVMDNGEVAEQGKYEELIKDPESKFSQLMSLQQDCLAS